MATAGPGSRSINFITRFFTQGHEQAVAAIKTYSQTVAAAQTGNVSAGRSFDLFKFAKYALGWTLVYRTINIVASSTADMIVQTIKLDEALRNVNVIAGLTEAELLKVRDRLIEMSVSAEGGLQSVQDLAQGLYLINSAGIVGAESLVVLGAASRAAMAGLSNTQTAATALISVLNAYGLSAEQAGHVSDVLFQTVKIGVPRFEDLATNISLTATVSAALGVSVEEMGLAWGALSRNMTDAAKTNIALSQLMLAFLKPTEQMREAIRMLGFENGQAMVKQLGFIGSLKALYSLAGTDATVWAGLVQNRRALQAALAFIREEFKLSSDAAKDYGDSVDGATTTAQQEQLKSYANQVKLMTSQWNALKIELGQGVLPTLIRILDVLSVTLQRMRQMREVLGDKTAVQPFNLTPLGALLYGTIFPTGYAQTLQRELEKRAKSLAGQSGAAIPGLSLKTTALDTFFPKAPLLPAGKLPAAAEGDSFAELMRKFRNAQDVAAGEFRTSELAAIGTTLLPAAYRELAAAQKVLIDLTKQQADALLDVKMSAEDYAKINDNVKDALKEVQQLEQNIAQLEGQRVQIAKELAGEARKLGEAYQKALESFAGASLEQAAETIRSVQRGFEMQLEPLRQFRDLMGEALDPDKARRLREEIQRLTLAQVNAEVEQLQRNLNWFTQHPQLDPEGRQRLVAGQQLIGAVQRRAGLQSQFGIENIRAGFSEQQRELNDRIARMQAALGKEFDPFGARARFFQQQISLAQKELKRMGETPEVTAEQIAKPYVDAQKLIADTQTQINNLLQANVDATGNAAKAAYDKLVQFGTLLSQVPWAGWGEQAGIAWREGFNKGLYPGQAPPGFVPQQGRAGGGGGSITIILNNVDLTGKVSEAGKQELIAATMSIGGDRAVQTERRRGTARQVG